MALRLGWLSFNEGDSWTLFKTNESPHKRPEDCSLPPRNEMTIVQSVLAFSIELIRTKDFNDPVLMRLRLLKEGPRLD